MRGRTRVGIYLVFQPKETSTAFTATLVPGRYQAAGCTSPIARGRRRQTSPSPARRRGLHASVLDAGSRDALSEARDPRRLNGGDTVAGLCNSIRMAAFLLVMV